MEVNPLHAPTYHSLAELEARVFNVEGLAKLNEKAAAIFNSNAMEPNPTTTQAWGAKIRAHRDNEIPKGVAALAEKIVEDDEEEQSAHGAQQRDVDPFEALESMSAGLIEDDLVGDLLDAQDSS